MWCGIIHHVVNQHQKVLGCSDSGDNSCKHGPLCKERDKDWLKADSPAHGALVAIVLDKRFMNRIPYFLNCRYSFIEKFNM